MLLRIVFLLIWCIRAQSVPLSEFFPYGTTIGDTLFPPNDDGSTNAIPLPKVFPYFNNNHRQIYLANNGLFSFLGPISQFVPDAFPLNDSRRLIAGFWSDIDTLGYVSNGNQVFYQVWTNMSNTTVFTKAFTYVQRYFPSESTFNPSMVITGTWYRVGAYSAQTARLNTFQIVLATDEFRSFVFFLYHDLQWGNPSNLNSTSGAQAGFNAGDGIVYESLPYSRTLNVVQLANMSNVYVPGLFVFRTDTDTIYIAGCGNTVGLRLRPFRGPQYGSTALIVQGPCFHNFAAGDVKCRFGSSTIVDAILVNEFEAICVTPASPLPGAISVYLSTDRGQTYRMFGTTFTYTPLQIGLAFGESTEVAIINQTSIIFGAGDNLTLSWFFSDGTQRLWPNRTIELEIHLVTVTRNTSNSGISLGTTRILRRHISPARGIQFASITVPTMNNNEQTGFIRVIARNNITNVVYASLSSSLFIIKVSSTTARSTCRTWIARQPEPSTWNTNLQFCPMTLRQARIARCCYDVDPLCNENGNYSAFNCGLRQRRPNRDESSAIACYISRWSNTYGAGSECCYNEEEQLITRGPGAGVDHRYWPISNPVSHFFEDVLPYVSCCSMSSDSETCSSYFEARPSRRGSNTRNVWGSTWGDPHYTTLDGSSFTFNGYGEYTYLAVSAASPAPDNFNLSTQTFSFMSQVRTTPIFFANGTMASTATVIRGFAAKSDHVQAQSVSISVSRREYLIVRRGSEVIDLFSTSGDSVGVNDLITVTFPELTMERNITTGTITLSWTQGISVQVTPITLTSPVNGTLVLNLGVSVAGTCQSRTYGLLGTYDNNETNDLRIPSGVVVGVADSMTIQEIYQRFGQTWAIDPRYSLFYYESGDSATFYYTQNQIFTPSFVNPQPAPAQVTIAQATCNISSANQSTWTTAQRTCYYDVAVTNDLTFGRTSLVTANRISEIAIDQRSPPVFNPSLGLIITVAPSSNITLNFSASSQYTSAIRYTLVAAPAASYFDNQTARFSWTAPVTSSNDTVVRVTAQDTVYNLTSTHDLTIQVRDLTTRAPTTTTTSKAVVGCPTLFWSWFCFLIMTALIM